MKSLKFYILLLIVFTTQTIASEDDNRLAKIYAERINSFIPENGKKVDSITTLTDIYYVESRHTVRWEALIDTTNPDWGKTSNFISIGKKTWSNRFKIKTPNDEQAKRWGIQTFFMVNQKTTYCSHKETVNMLSSIKLSTEKVFYDIHTGELLAALILSYDVCEDGPILSLY